MALCRSEPRSRFRFQNMRRRTINAPIATAGRSYSGGPVWRSVGASPARDSAFQTRAGARSTRGSRPGVAPAAEARHGFLQERAPLAIPPSRHAPAHDQRADRDRGSLLQRRHGMALCRSEPRSRCRSQNTRRCAINAPIATAGRSCSGGPVWRSVGASPARDSAFQTRAGARSTRGSRPGVAPTSEARYGFLQERAPLAMPLSKHALAHDQRADLDRGSLLQRRPGMALCRSEPRSRFRSQNTRRCTINARIATAGRSYSGGTLWLSAGASPARDSALKTCAGARSTRGSRPRVAPTAEARYGALQERAPLVEPVGHAGPTMEWLLRKP